MKTKYHKWMEHKKKWYYVSFGNSSEHSTRCLGNKTEPYYETEAEMLSCAVYNYETLSKDEKIIYNKTEK